MAKPVLHPDHDRQSTGGRLYMYMRNTARSLDMPNSVAEQPQDVRALDRFLSFRYVLRCEEWRAALGRLEEGKYGICLHCHGPVSRSELEVDPLRRFCGRCERRFCGTGSRRGPRGEATGGVMDAPRQPRR